MTEVLHITAVAPPLNVQATQAKDSAPLEISWSHPSDGDVTITGYRIFYSSIENVSVPSVITGISLALNKHFLGQSVSVRSEANHLTSELISVTITSKPYSIHCVHPA